MSVLTILAVATGRPDDASALAIAGDLAERHASSVTVVNAFESLATPMMPMYAGAVGREALRSAAEGAREVREVIDAEVGRQRDRFGLAAELGERPAMIIGGAGDTGWGALMRELPLADIVVVGHSNASIGGAFAGPFGEALMEAKAPVFVARGQDSAAGRPAAVAWDGSLQAGRAVRVAIPFLKEASAVAILQDTDELDTAAGAQGDPARLQRYLQSRGILTAGTVAVRGRNAGEALLKAAGELGAALLVAGAYGHSRIGEALFGGATRTLLSARIGPHLVVSH